MVFLERVELLEPDGERRDQFPFTVAALASHLGERWRFRRR